MYEKVTKKSVALQQNLVQKRNKSVPNQKQFKVGQKVLKVNNKRDKKENKPN